MPKKKRARVIDDDDSDNDVPSPEAPAAAPVAPEAPAAAPVAAPAAEEAASPPDEYVPRLEGWENERLEDFGGSPQNEDFGGSLEGPKSEVGWEDEDPFADERGLPAGGSVGAAPKGGNGEFGEEGALLGKENALGEEGILGKEGGASMIGEGNEAVGEGNEAVGEEGEAVGEEGEGAVDEDDEAIGADESEDVVQEEDVAASSVDVEQDGIGDRADEPPAGSEPENAGKPPKKKLRRTESQERLLPKEGESPEPNKTFRLEDDEEFDLDDADAFAGANDYVPVAGAAKASSRAAPFPGTMEFGHEVLDALKKRPLRNRNLSGLHDDRPPSPPPQQRNKDTSMLHDALHGIVAAPTLAKTEEECELDDMRRRLDDIAKYDEENFDPTKPRLMIHQIHMENFKSYGGKKKIGGTSLFVENSCTILNKAMM